jgi:hypothetical protein
LNVPAGVTYSVSGTNLTVEADGSTATPPVFQYEVSDGQDTVTANVTLTVTLCQVTAISPTSRTVEKFTKGANANTLKDDVTFTLTTTGNCAGILDMEYDNDLTNGYQGVPRPFNDTTKQVTFNKQAETWTPTGDFPMTVLKRGTSTGITATMTVTT